LSVLNFLENVVNSDFDGKCPICGRKLKLIYRCGKAKFYRCPKTHEIKDKSGRIREISPVYMVKEAGS